MNHSYWSKSLTYRIGRRRALAATGGTALAAALLAACGSSGSSSGSGGSGNDKSSLVSQPVDTTKQAVRGGVLKDRAPSEPNTLDIGNAVAPLNLTAKNVYNMLMVEKPGYLGPSKDELVGDLAESYEFSPDGLQLTFKLRQGVKFHNKPPVNGRLLDADDVVFSWNRFTKKSPVRGNADNSVNPVAPILSVTATDPRTVVVKLKEPVVYTLGIFASYGSFSGQVVIVPKEADSGFDMRNDMIGTGPFVLADYKPSTSFTLKRNPDYWDKDYALVDQIDLPIIIDYSSSLAQFKAGNIYYLPDRQIKGEDILSVKKENPHLGIFKGDYIANTNVITFGMKPEPGAATSPFFDERVRQAVSKSWDRDTWLDAFYNITDFTSQGLPVETRWNSALTARWDGWWLDPKGKDFGPDAKNYEFNLADAKKLLSAAGYPNGLDVTSHHITTNEVANLSKYAETLDGMVQDAGIRIKLHPVDYATEYIPNYRDASGQFNGWAYHTVSGAVLIGPVHSLAAEHWSKSGITFHGYSADGQNDQSGDPALNAMIEKSRIEQDTERRRALIFDIQRYLGKKMYSLIVPGAATGFTMAWPALQNYGVYSIVAAKANYGIWLDTTKPPFKNA